MMTSANTDANQKAELYGVDQAVGSAALLSTRPKLDEETFIEYVLRYLDGR